jgi:ADP-ribose pyrophosphatase YjhB (NUDIX family)
MIAGVKCPECGRLVYRYRNPIPTVDVIMEIDRAVVLIERKNPPHGWALPGGFIDYGESAEEAAVREAAEETSLRVTELRLFGVYSEPDRDPRHHTLTVVFTARCEGVPRAADDAAQIGVFPRESLPSPIAFDHAKILDDYFRSRDGS